MTLHDAGIFLSTTHTEQSKALHPSLTVDVKGGGWRVSIVLAPLPAENGSSLSPKSSKTGSNATEMLSEGNLFLNHSDSSRPLLEKNGASDLLGNNSSNVGAQTSSYGHIVVVELSALSTASESAQANWSRAVDVTVEATLDDLRFHNHPPPSIKRSLVYTFTRFSPTCKLAFPLTGLFYPERSAHKFDIGFLFTLHGAQVDSVGRPFLTDSPPDWFAVDGGRPSSVSSSRTATRASIETTRPLPALPQNSEELGDHVKLPQASLDIIATTLNEAIWGDVCFVLKDPNVNNGYAFVFGNSKLLSRRSAYFRHLVDDLSQNSLQDAIKVLEGVKEMEKEVEHHFPHEVADSDFCADAGSPKHTEHGASLSDIEIGRTLSPGSQPSSEQGSRLADDPSSTATAAAAAAAIAASAQAGRSLSLARFRNRKLRIKNIFDEPLDIFGHRPEDTSGARTDVWSMREAGDKFAKLSLAVTIKYVAVADVAITTFKRIIFWLETDHIVFAPLSSSAGGENNTGDNRQSNKAVADVAKGFNNSDTTGWASPAARNRFVENYLRLHPLHPPPASAKSIYRLAEAYGLVELQNLAMASIRSQLAPSNILRELFSPFTLKHAKIREMQLEYALEHWEDIKTKYSSNLDTILEQSHFTPEAARLLGRMLSMATMDSRKVRAMH